MLRYRESILSVTISRTCNAAGYFVAANASSFNLVMHSITLRGEHDLVRNYNLTKRSHPASYLPSSHAAAAIILFPTLRFAVYMPCALSATSYPYAFDPYPLARVPSPLPTIRKCKSNRSAHLISRFALCAAL